MDRLEGRDDKFTPHDPQDDPESFVALLYRVSGDPARALTLVWLMGAGGLVAGLALVWLMVAGGLAVGDQAGYAGGIAGGAVTLFLTVRHIRRTRR